MLIGVLLVMCILAMGCEKRLGSLASLDGKLGVLVTVDEEKWQELGESLIGYLRGRLKQMTVTGSTEIETVLGSYGFAALDARHPDALRSLREDLGVEYLLTVDLVDINDGSTTSTVEFGTNRSKFTTAVNTTVTLVYALYDTESGAEILSGKEVGESDEIVGVKIGSDGSRLGVRVAREADLVREALMDAVKKTGWL